MPKGNRRLPQTNPHTLPPIHSLTWVHSYFHLPADGKNFFSSVPHTATLLFLKQEITPYPTSSRSTENTHINEQNTSYCRSHLTSAVFFTLYFFFTAVTFMYHTTPTWKAFKNTVVNWLSEQFVYPTRTCKNFKCNKSNLKKKHKPLFCALVVFLKKKLTVNKKKIAFQSEIQGQRNMT